MNRVARDLDKSNLDLPMKTVFRLGDALLAQGDEAVGAAFDEAASMVESMERRMEDELDILASKVFQGNVCVGADDYLEVCGSEPELELGSDDKRSGSDDKRSDFEVAGFDETKVDLLGDVEGVVLEGNEEHYIPSISEKKLVSPLLKLLGEESVNDASDDTDDMDGRGDFRFVSNVVARCPDFLKEGVEKETGESETGKRKRETEPVPLWVGTKLRKKHVGWQCVWASLNDGGTEFLLEPAREWKSRVAELTEVQDRKMTRMGRSLPTVKPYVYAAALSKASRKKQLVTALHPTFKGEKDVLGKNPFGNLASVTERKSFHGLKSGALDGCNGSVYFYVG